MSILARELKPKSPAIIMSALFTLTVSNLPRTAKIGSVAMSALRWQQIKWEVWMPKEPTKRICDKNSPFPGGEVKPDEYWEHTDAYEAVPEYDGEVVAYHCPNCGTDFIIDYR
jgi:hypothetical protein